LSQIIALTGLAGSGKSTAADYLVENHGFVRVKFAGPLKAMLSALGLSGEHIEGSLKEVPTPLLNGRTPRYAMQTLGTEWGRDLIAPDLWTTLWRREVRAALAAGNRVVTDDCRFLNEGAAVEAAGGIVVRIACPWSGLATGGAHASENGALVHDVVVANDVKDDLSGFYRQLDALVG
jgi:hypothetical protein